MEGDGCSVATAYVSSFTDSISNPAGVMGKSVEHLHTHHDS